MDSNGTCAPHCAWSGLRVRRILAAANAGARYFTGATGYQSLYCAGRPDFNPFRVFVSGDPNDHVTVSNTCSRNKQVPIHGAPLAGFAQRLFQLAIAARCSSVRVDLHDQRLFVSVFARTSDMQLIGVPRRGGSSLTPGSDRVPPAPTLYPRP